jgi:hypothetical protein
VVDQIEPVVAMYTADWLAWEHARSDLCSRSLEIAHQVLMITGNCSFILGTYNHHQGRVVGVVGSEDE